MRIVMTWAMVFFAATSALGQQNLQPAKKLTDEEKRNLAKDLSQTSQPIKLSTQPASAPATQPAQTQPAGAAPADQQPAIGEGLSVRVKLETSMGDILLELDGQRAPISTRNFVTYVRDGFYNGLIFHRVMKDFMIQGGGFSVDMVEKKEGVKPPIKNEWQNGLKNVTGTIAMARTNAPDSATCQFFINVVDNPALDQPRGGAAYAVFGRVLDGMDTVERIRNTEVGEHPRLPMGPVVPATPVIIRSAQVVGDYPAEKIDARIADGDRAAREAVEKAAAESQKQLTDFIAATETRAGKKFQKTESGLMHLVLTEGSGAQPTASDEVEVHYVGTFLDGKQFDSSVARGQPAKFPLNRVIRGWTEGVAMMKVGEKRILICPPDLAYGPQGRPGIPPNSTLVFEVELLGVTGK